MPSHPVLVSAGPQRWSVSLLLVAVLATALLTLASESLAVTPAQRTWDLGADFKPSGQQANPSPDRYGNPGVWRYGREPENAPGTNFSLLPTFTPNFFYGDAWNAGLFETIGRNFGAAQNCNPARVTCSVAPGDVIAHPDHGNQVIARWTSPTAGTVRVAGSVLDSDQFGGGQRWTLRGPSGATLATGVVGPAPSAPPVAEDLDTFDVQVPVSVSGVVDLVINSNGGDITSDSTEIAMTITLPPPPPPPPPAGTPTECPAGTSASVRCLRDAKGRLAMEGSDASETFIGTNGPDRISPRGGDDIVFARGGDDLLSGGPGEDELHGEAGADRLNGNAGNDSLAGNEGNDSISGEGGDDRLNGNSDNDGLWGGPGNDSISGATGNDRLRGLSGNDSLSGGPGQDLLSGGPGNDNLTGGPDLDHLRCGPGHDNIHEPGDDDIGSSCPQP